MRMKRIGISRRAGLATITALFALLAVGGAALAYFSTAGVGTASASAGTLSAPTITSAAAGAGTVQLTWSAVTPPAGSGPVKYYVSRGGSAPAGNCPSSASPGAGTSCTDSGLEKGTYSYTVTAVWQSWTATSAPATSVTLASGAASQLVFTTQPDGNATGGKAFPTQPVVTAEDAGGNTVTSYTGTISLAIKSGTGASGATLSGCTGSLSNGVTTFAGCAIDKAATGYQLSATDTTLNATSAPFNVAVGPAAQLIFTTQPDGNATGGKAFPTQPVITAQDAGGNIVTNYAGTVSLRLKAGTGTTGATLSGCSGSPSNGVTTFSGCTIDKNGTGYQLTATDTTLTTDSAPFNVSVGPAAHLVFTTQPDGNATAGSAFPTQPKLTIEDAGGNAVTTDTSTVALSITSGTPAQGGPGALSGCSQTETSGVISLSGCTINTAGNGYKLHATDGGLPAVDTAAFNVSTTAPSVAITYPVNSSTYGANWTGTITGTASANGGLSITGSAVAIEDTTTGKWWSNGTFSAASQTFVPATGTTSWSYALAASNLTPGHNYTVTGQATDSLGNVGTSTTVAFAYGAASVSVIGQGAVKSSTISGVKTTNGATDLIVIYCYGGSSCGSTGSTPIITGPFASVSTSTIQSIVFNGSTKSCVEVVQATGNGQTGAVSVSFGGGSADTVGLVNVLELSPGATVKSVGINPASQTSSTSPLATLGTTTGLSEIALVGLDGNQGNDTITAPTGMSALTPLSGFTNPESSSAIGVAGGDLGMYFTPTAQASATFSLSPTAVDWGTVALGIG
jgi:trimeric autotransporter adhesin